ncbi:MAG: hypothetical protein HXY20_15570 [Acidobacteria bacterium]|jgi:hypothetical protein|nr:hypothetical protein [Acidobacteriota bacterium]
MNQTQVPSGLNRLQMLALIVGGVGFVLLMIGWFLSPAQFFPAYLVGYILWMQVALGCLAILMIYNMTGGGWGYVTQRILRAGMLTLPLLAVLFLPILLGLPTLYEWARPAAVAHDELLQHKSLYLNIPFFIARTVLYFVVWIGLALLLNRWLLHLDQSFDLAAGRRLRGLSGLGLGAFGLTVTFASIDWMMSIEPHWFSTIYGFMFATGAVAAAFALAIIVLNWLMKRTSLVEVVSTLNVNDLGNFLLAGVMLWAYMTLSQYLIIWSGNLAEETPWIYRRTTGGWEVVGLLLTIFHFFAPFLVLLSRTVKRRINWLVNVAGLVLLMRLVDLYWLIIPAFHESFYLDWLMIVAPIAIGGIWLAAFIWQLKKKSLLPLYDAGVEEKLLDYGRTQTSTHS